MGKKKFPIPKVAKASAFKGKKFPQPKNPSKPPSVTGKASTEAHIPLHGGMKRSTKKEDAGNLRQVQAARAVSVLPRKVKNRKV